MVSLFSLTIILPNQLSASNLFTQLKRFIMEHSSYAQLSNYKKPDLQDIYMHLYI